MKWGTLSSLLEISMEASFTLSFNFSVPMQRSLVALCRFLLSAGLHSSVLTCDSIILQFSKLKCHRWSSPVTTVWKGCKADAVTGSRKQKSKSECQEQWGRDRHEASRGDTVSCWLLGMQNIAGWTVQTYCLQVIVGSSVKEELTCTTPLTPAFPLVHVQSTGSKHPGLTSGLWGLASLEALKSQILRPMVI